MVSINTNKNKKVFAFYREKDDNRVLVFLNLRLEEYGCKSCREESLMEGIQIISVDRRCFFR